MILGVILAGGQSSRMGGGDKTLRELAGRTLLSHVVERLTPQVDALALNANGDLSRFSEFDMPVLPDSIDGFAGPLAGILSGMDWGAKQGAESIVTVAADTPFFPTDLVKHLRAANAPMAMAFGSHPEPKFARHPTFGLWPVELRDDLRAALEAGVRKVVQWTSKHGCAEVRFDDTAFDPFFNVNTPADLAKAEQMYLENSI